MKIINIVFLLCISNVFAMQIPATINQNQEGIYVFNDGVFCIVQKYIRSPLFNVFTGWIKEDNGFEDGRLQSFSGNSLQECFDKFIVKNYKDKDIIFSKYGSYDKTQARKEFNENKVFQKIADNRNERIEKLKKDLKKAKIKNQANIMKNFLFGGMIVGGTLVFILCLVYKEYKAQQNKADYLAKLDDEAAKEENDMLILEELTEKNIKTKEENL